MKSTNHVFDDSLLLSSSEEEAKDKEISQKISNESSGNDDKVDEENIDFWI